MRVVGVSVLLMMLAGCASTTWNFKVAQDEFTDKVSCKVAYGSDLSKGFVRSSVGGIHYYPFIEKVNDDVVFGVHNDYNVPVGDVQIRIDGNESILISYSETPVYYSASAQPVDLSYLSNIEGIDQEAVKASIDKNMKNISKMSSPFTAVSGDKAKLIIDQMKGGEVLKLRVIGFGTNSVASTTGEYNLGESLVSSLSGCGI